MATERKLVRVCLSFDDGSEKFVEGEEAQRWLSAVRSEGDLAALHDFCFPELKWIEVPTPKTVVQRIRDVLRTIFSKHKICLHSGCRKEFVGDGSFCSRACGDRYNNLHTGKGGTNEP